MRTKTSFPTREKKIAFCRSKFARFLGMPTYVDRDMLSAYYFHTLVNGSREVHIFFAENGRKEKSRFVEQLLWERQKKDKAKSAAGYIRSLKYRLSLQRAVRLRPSERRPP